MGGTDELVGAFAAAVPFALGELAATEAVLRESRPAAGDRFAAVAAAVRLSAAGGTGRVVLSLPADTAAALARRVLAGAVDEPAADVVADCAGEVANVVAGQAKALLVGNPAHFNLSTPTPPAEPAAAGWVLEFDSDAGPFAVYLEPPV